MYILGAGFSRAIGLCKVEETEFSPPLDSDFFSVLDGKQLLRASLAIKPCLACLLDWVGVYDQISGSLKKVDFSLEKFWTQVLLMAKLNSSISGFPQFGFLASQNCRLVGMPDDERKLFDFLSYPQNVFNDEGMVLDFADYEIQKLIFEVYSTISYSHDNESLIEKFKKIVDGDSIVSFNYDCLVEKIFGSHLLFSYADRNNLQDESSIIMKPHGSLGWLVRKRFSRINKKEIEVLDHIIMRAPEDSGFSIEEKNDHELISKMPIIIPMAPGKENFVSGLDPQRMELWGDNASNSKNEFIDCIVSYAKMLQRIRDAQRVVFIGYSFPATDYESITLLDLAFNSSPQKEIHICVKGDSIPDSKIRWNKVTYYKDGFEQFVNEFI